MSSSLSEFAPYPAPREPRREDFDSDSAYQDAYRDWQALHRVWIENHKDVRVERDDA